MGLRQIDIPDPMDTGAAPGFLKVVCISDTHGTHASVQVPDGDILIHAGDFTKVGWLGCWRGDLEGGQMGSCCSRTLYAHIHAFRICLRLTRCSQRNEPIACMGKSGFRISHLTTNEPSACIGGWSF